jgi:putative ABC transport system ATP-binding protein
MGTDNSNFSGKAIIQVRNLEKDFDVADKFVKVLKNIDFDIYEGEFVIISGASGSGKSTLLHIINGWEEPTHGDILIEGKNIYLQGEEQRSELYRNTIVAMHQTPYWIHSLNVLENIAIPYTVMGYGHSEANARAMELISLLGLEEYSHYKPSNLSVGQQQRVNLIRSLINNPKIIIADEPTGNLDAKSTEVLMNLLLELNVRLHRTIIMATHNLELLRYANKIIKISDGVATEIDQNKKTSSMKATGDILDIAETIRERLKEDEAK